MSMRDYLKDYRVKRNFDNANEALNTVLHNADTINKLTAREQALISEVCDILTWRSNQITKLWND